eukprot:GHVT01095965.1.p1 GENE.GHVT01095965.1~~GHVT01095965.1.p1  ORF type:complete len:267 (+),score=51.44 GHVT01095965.1:967-1767(+)
MSAAVRCRRFEGKVAVVTASSAGIGFAIAKRLALEGATVFISSRSASHVARACEELRGCLPAVGAAPPVIHGLVCHVEKPQDRENLIEVATQKGTRKIDVLVCNAAVSPSIGPTLDTSETQVDKILSVNLKSVFSLIVGSASHFSSGASVLLVSSYLGFTPCPPLGWYGVSKTALFALTKALAKELYGAHDGVRINAVAPGVIRTEFSRMLWDSPEASAQVNAQTCMDRVGEASEVAAAAAFLCSEDASYITGEVLAVSGGMPSRL